MASYAALYFLTITNIAVLHIAHAWTFGFLERGAINNLNVPWVLLLLRSAHFTIPFLITLPNST
jgi:hypothetical protein